MLCISNRDDENLNSGEPGPRALIFLVAMMLMAASGCGFGPIFPTGTADSNDSAPANANAEESSLSFSSPQLPAIADPFPVAVGTKVEVIAEDVATIEDVIVGDEETFVIEDIGGDKITIRAVKSGQSTFKVFADTGSETTKDGEFTLSADEIAEADLEPSCSMLDWSEQAVGVAFDGDQVWLTNEIYDADIDVRSSENKKLRGDGLPFYFEPSGAAEFADQSLDSTEIVTGSQEEESGTMESTVSDWSIPFPLIHEIESVSEINLVRFEVDAEEPHYTITEPGAEPVLDVEENSRYLFLPHRFHDGRVVCEPSWSLERLEFTETQVTTLTPEVCMVDNSRTEDPDHQNPKESVTVSFIGTLDLKSEGECIVEMEFLDGPADYELIEEFRWTVE